MPPKRQKKQFTGTQGYNVTFHSTKTAGDDETAGEIAEEGEMDVVDEEH